MQVFLGRKNIFDEAIEYFEASPARESCGLIIQRRWEKEFLPCKNISEFDDNFQIDPKDWISAEEKGRIVRILHSHIKGDATASQSDKVSCSITNLPWSIYSLENKEWSHINPTPFVPPLIGREWAHGVLDCYALVRDYYKEILSINIPDYKREFEWWQKGKNLLIENFEQAGFIEVSIKDIKKHDGLIMQIHSPVPNHAAVYLGNETILHHLHRKLSSRDELGGYYKRHTVKVVRHKSL